MKLAKKTYTFYRGWNALPYVHRSEFRKEVMDLYGYKYITSFNQRMRNVFRKDEYDAVTAIFARYGLNEHEIWDEKAEAGSEENDA